MADFLKALAYTLKHEGGWSDDPDDPGGATNFGITLKTAQQHGVADKAALRSITQEKVAEIYRAGYWRHGGIDDQRVATKLFDMAVNMGPAAAEKLLTRALTRHNPETAARLLAREDCSLLDVNAHPPGDVLAALCKESEDHYRAIVAKRPASAKFLKGWLRRAKEVPSA